MKIRYDTAVNVFKFLWQIAAVLLAILGVFILRPLGWSASDDAVWFGLARFLVAVLVGLLFVATQLYQEAQHTRIWVISTVATLMFGIGSCLAYTEFRDQWSCDYAGGLVLIGSQYTADTIGYLQKTKVEEHRDLNCHDLLMRTRGAVAEIWEPIGVRSRRMKLAFLYLASILLTASAAICVAQAAHCVQRRSSRRKSTSTKATGTIDHPACFVFVIIAATHGATDAQQTAKADGLDLRLAPAAEIRERAKPKRLDLTRELEKIVETETKALCKVAQLQVKVEVSDTEDDTLSYPIEGIIVSRKQLDRIQQRSDVKQRREVIRLILAHEMSHQMQFKKYGVDKIRESDNEHRRVLECQADILAGKYLIETLAKPQPNQQEVILDALQVSCDLGMEKATIGDHPDHEARRQAMRRGMASGVITNLSGLLQTPLAAGAQTSIQLLRAKLDIADNEKTLDWSLRQAKRIVHVDSAAADDLEISNLQSSFLPDGTIDYSFDYMNTGKATLEIDLEVRCDWVQAKEEHETKTRYLWSTNNIRRQLAAGQRKHHRGKLPYSGPPEMFAGMDVAILKPILIAPKEDIALWSIEQVKPP